MLLLMLLSLTIDGLESHKMTSNAVEQTEGIRAADTAASDIYIAGNVTRHKAGVCRAQAAT